MLTLAPAAFAGSSPKAAPCAATAKKTTIAHAPAVRAKKSVAASKGKAKTSAAAAKVKSDKAVPASTKPAAKRARGPVAV